MLHRLWLSVRAILLGVIVNLTGSGIFGSTILLILMVIMRHENAMGHYAARVQGQGIMLTLLAGGSLFAILGGYVGARTAKCREFLHALIAGIISLGVISACLACFSVLENPVRYGTAAAILVVPIALLCGYIARKKNKEEIEGAEAAGGKGKKWGIVPERVPSWITVLLIVIVTAYGAVSWGLVYGVHAYYAGQKKHAPEMSETGSSHNVLSRLVSGFEAAFIGNDKKKIVILSGTSKTQTFECLALPVQDAQGLIWCIRKDRPSDLACWDGEQWRFTELPGIAADPRGPDGAAILVDDADRVLVISARGPAGFGPGEIDVNALEDEYRQYEYLFVDKGLLSRMEQKSRASKGRSGYRISALSSEDVTEIFSPMLRRHDLCSLVNMQQLGLGSSFLVQKVRTCDNNSSTDMIVTANKLLLSKMYPRTFAKSFREKAYRVGKSSGSAVEVFPDYLSLLTDSVRSGSRAFRGNGDQPPLVYKKKIIYDGKCFGSDTLNFAYIGKDAMVGAWQDNLVAVQFKNAAGGDAAGDVTGKTVPSKCMLCGSMSNGLMRVVYEDGEKQQIDPGSAGPAAVLAKYTVKMPEHIDGIYPFKGGFSYFDPAAESIVLCSSGGYTSEIKMNEGLIGRAGIQVFDAKVYEENKGALFPVRKSRDGVYVFTSLDDFNHSASSGNAQVNAVKLPGYIENVYPVPGGFAVNDHQSGKITVYVKDYTVETGAGFYGENKLNINSAVLVDKKGSLWINTDGRVLEISRDAAFPQEIQ